MLDQSVPNPLAKNPNFYTHKVFAAIGLILIGTVVAVAGVWYYMESNSKGTAEEDNSVKVSTSSAKPATTSATKDITAEWKTFSHPVIGFSIKYPETWLTNECEKTTFFFAPTKETLGVCASEFGGMVGIFFIDENYTTYVAGESFNDISYLEGGKKETVTVNGKSAIKISGKYKEDGGTISVGDQTIRYFFDIHGKVLYLNYFAKTTWQDYSKEFEQMVQTLNFL